MKKETGMIVDSTLLNNASFSIVSWSFSTLSSGWISDVEFLDTIWIERFAAEGTSVCV
jgi:hypothetical protein